MQTLNKKTQSFGLLLLLSVSFNSFADVYHYKDILIGDRAAGLAGAFTAISDDASGLYYNPAGVVYSSQSKISGSVNAYGYKTTKYGDINSSGQTWTRTSSGMIANYFGIIQPLAGSEGVVGFSIAVPNYELENQNDAFHNFGGSSRSFSSNNNLRVTEVKDFLIDYNNEDSTTLAGVSYSRTLSDTFSFGVTLYSYLRKKELTNWQYTRATISDSSDNSTKVFEGTIYQKIQTDEFGLQPRLGIMWTPFNKLSVGLMVQGTAILNQSPKYRYYDRGSLCDSDGTSNCKLFSFSDNNRDGTVDADTVAIIDELVPNLKSNTNNSLPIESNLGIAYFTSDDLLYSADFSYNNANSNYEATWNAAFGTEYFLNATWGLRGGVYTNNANTPETKRAGMREHINLYGLAFSLSRYTKGSNITLGANVYQGSGNADLNPNTALVQTINVFGANLFLSTSAAF